MTVLDDDFSADADGESDIDSVYLYTGRERSPETGLQLTRHRYYRSELGRWVSRDPARPNDSSRVGSFYDSTETVLRNEAYASALSGLYNEDLLAPYHDGMNLYQYVQSSPVMHTDPSGKWAFVIPIITFGRGGSNAFLACQNFTNCQDCLARAGDLKRRAQETLNEEAYNKWLAAAKPGEECHDICIAAGERGVRALVWFFGGVYVRGITPVR